MRSDNFDDFCPRSPELGNQYESAALTARLVYEDRLRCAGEAYRLYTVIAATRTHTPLIARFGAALVYWGERLQAAGVTTPPAHSLDAHV